MHRAFQRAAFPDNLFALLLRSLSLKLHSCCTLSHTVFTSDKKFCSFQIAKLLKIILTYTTLTLMHDPVTLTHPALTHAELTHNAPTLTHTALTHTPQSCCAHSQRLYSLSLEPHSCRLNTLTTDSLSRMLHSLSCTLHSCPIHSCCNLPLSLSFPNQEPNDQTHDQSTKCKGSISVQYANKNTHLYGNKIHTGQENRKDCFTCGEFKV